MNRQQGTVTTVAKIDVGADGVTITLEGLDNDLASLMAKAIDYEVANGGEPEYLTYQNSILTIRTKKALSFVDRVEEVPVPPEAP